MPFFSDASTPLFNAFWSSLASGDSNRVSTGNDGVSDCLKRLALFLDKYSEPGSGELYHLIVIGLAKQHLSENGLLCVQANDAGSLKGVQFLRMVLEYREGLLSEHQAANFVFYDKINASYHPLSQPDVEVQTTVSYAQVLASVGGSSKPLTLAYTIMQAINSSSPINESILCVVGSVKSRGGEYNSCQPLIGKSRQTFAALNGCMTAGTFVSCKTIALSSNDFPQINGVVFDVQPLEKLEEGFQVSLTWRSAFNGFEVWHSTYVAEHPLADFKFFRNGQKIDAPYNFNQGTGVVMRVGSFDPLSKKFRNALFHCELSSEDQSDVGQDMIEAPSSHDPDDSDDFI